MNFKYWFLILILLSVILFLTLKYSIPSNKITASEAEKLISEGAVVIDVRTYIEYKSGHIKNAQNIPYNKINEETINLNKNTNIIVYCRSGSRSAEATEILENLGYYNVYDLGSIDNWTRGLVKG